MQKTPSVAAVAAVIKAAMEEKGLRQCDLLVEFGYSRSRASEVVRGIRRPTRAIALRLSRRLNIPIKQLISE